MMATARSRSRPAARIEHVLGRHKARTTITLILRGYPSGHDPSSDVPERSVRQWATTCSLHALEHDARSLPWAGLHQLQVMSVAGATSELRALCLELCDVEVPRFRAGLSADSDTANALQLGAAEGVALSCS